MGRMIRIFWVSLRRLGSVVGPRYVLWKKRGLHMTSCPSLNPENPGSDRQKNMSR